MKSLGRLLRDAEERSQDVRSLHGAMAMAADHPSPEANAALFAALGSAHLWAFYVGEMPRPDRLDAQARLSGFVGLRFRVGRTTEGEVYLPVGTTGRRLAESGFGVPGDTMVRWPFRMLAYTARDGGADSLVINPGSTPFGHLAGSALATFADGATPDPVDPEGQAKMKLTDVGQPEVIDPTTLPEGLLAALADGLVDKPSVAAASLTVCRIGQARGYMLLVATRSAGGDAGLNDRMARRVVHLIGPEDYFAIENVDAADPRLVDPGRSVALLPAD